MVHDEAMEKMGKQLNSCTHEMMTDFFTSRGKGIVVRLKAKDIYSHVTQGYENVKPVSASAGWLTHFRR